MTYTETEEKEIEEAIEYLVFSIEQTGRNPKPVMLHSIRVGLYLYQLGYPKDIIIGGILHDLLEDTDVSFEDIKKQFGGEIARLVQACSFDENIQDKTQQYKEATTRCLREGKEALIIRTADIIDNIPYMLNILYAKDLHDFLREKISYFIDTVKGIMADELVFQELNELFDKYTKPTSI